MEIPQLYHGSVAEIETFIPRDGINNAFKEYHGTLGTELKSRAMLYALKVKEGYDPSNMETALGGVKDSRGVDLKDFMICNHTINGTPCAIFRDRQKFLDALEKAGGGGTIYTLPNHTFTEVIRDDGICAHEWCSTANNITPINSEHVTLEGAMKAGGQILFLKDGMGYYDFVDIFKPHQQEMMETQSHADLYRKMIAQGVLFDENAHRGIKNPLNLSEQINNQIPMWSEMPRNTQGYRRGVKSEEMSRY